MWIRASRYIAAALFLALVTSCAGDTSPGKLQQVWELAAETPTAVQGAKAWRFEYTTVGMGGHEVIATAMAVRPEGPLTEEPLKVVLWGHPTRGLADACAASQEGPATISGLGEFVQRGWAVVAPDYEGLGGEGPHPYLVGESEARSSLDAVRAAGQIQDSGITAESPVALWGFSQGGHAMLHAAEMASAYAPELDIVGVAVAAPVTDVVVFAERALQTPGQLGVFAAIVAGYDAAYEDVSPEEILTAEGADRLGVTASGCMDEILEAYEAPVGDLVADSASRSGPLWDRMAQNQAGTSSHAMAALVVWGSEDDIVYPADSAALVRRLCEQGSPVAYLERPGEAHGVTTVDVVPDWLDERFAGGPAPNDC